MLSTTGLCTDAPVTCKKFRARNQVACNTCLIRLQISHKENVSSPFLTKKVSKHLSQLCVAVDWPC